MSAQPVLDVRNVSHGFNDQSGHRLSVLESLDLRINPGDSVAIIGPSGAGKSTLLSLLAGLDIPESGESCFKARHSVASLKISAQRFGADESGLSSKVFNYSKG